MHHSHVQVRGLVDAVEGLLSATAAAAGHVATVASPSTAQVEDARDVCLSRLEALRTAAHALPATIPAPAVSGGNTGSHDLTLEALRAERDQLRGEVKRKNRDVKAMLDAMRSLQADLVTIQTQRQQALGEGSSAGPS